MTCPCDPEIRCAECHGCECRAGTCGGACVPEEDWAPTMDTPAGPVAHWRREPAGRVTFRHHMPAVAELLDTGLTTVRIAEVLGISPSMAYRARRALREEAA